MYQDYVDRINEKYHSLRASNKLSHRLAQPTPARLREECLDRYIARFDRRDENTLKVFFRHTEEIQTLAQRIENFDLDKFRPLIKFLNGQIKTTDQKNIELLAWLIDYKQRPFEFGGDYDSDGDDTKDDMSNEPLDNNETEEIGKKGNNPDTGLTGERIFQTKKPASKKRLLIIVAGMLALALIGYKVGFNNKAGTSIAGHAICMYWTGDHYEPISCQQRSDTLVVPLDSMRLRNFRRIIKTDTISQHSVGKLWYRKKNNKLEIYTAGGSHPVDMRVKLRILTDHMFKKYLNKSGP